MQLGENYTAKWAPLGENFLHQNISTNKTKTQLNT